MAEESILILKMMPYNGRLLKLRKAMGLTQKELGDAVGANVQKIRDIESLRQVADRETKQEISDFFNVSLEYLFPEVLDEGIVSGLFATRAKELGEAQLIQIGHTKRKELASGNEVVDFETSEDVKRGIGNALDHLTFKERRVLELRFGIIDGRSRTLEETGRDLAHEFPGYDVTRERIRQIEAKALRKLRHPRRARAFEIIGKDGTYGWQELVL